MIQDDEGLPCFQDSLVNKLSSRYKRTKGIENGTTRRGSFRQVARRTHGHAVFSGGETRECARDLDDRVRLRQRQITQNIVITARCNLTHGFAASRHDELAGLQEKRIILLGTAGQRQELACLSSLWIILGDCAVQSLYDVISSE